MVKKPMSFPCKVNKGGKCERAKVNKEGCCRGPVKD